MDIFGYGRAEKRWSCAKRCFALWLRVMVMVHAKVAWR